MTQTPELEKLSVLLEQVKPEYRQGVYERFKESVEKGVEGFLAATLEPTFTIDGKDVHDELVGMSPEVAEFFAKADLQERLDKLNRDTSGEITFTEDEIRKNFQEIATKRQRPAPKRRTRTRKKGKIKSQNAAKPKPQAPAPTEDVPATPLHAEGDARREEGF